MKNSLLPVFPFSDSEISSEYEKLKYRSQKEQLSSLYVQIDAAIKSYSRKKSINKSGASLFYMAIILLTSLTTLLIAASKSTFDLFPECELGFTSTRLSSFSLVTSALLTIAVGLEKYFDWKEFWVSSALACKKLSVLGLEVCQVAAYEPTKLSQEDIDKVYQNYKDLMKEIHDNYHKVRLA